PCTTQAGSHPPAPTPARLQVAPRSRPSSRHPAARPRAPRSSDAHSSPTPATTPSTAAHLHPEEPLVANNTFTAAQNQSPLSDAARLDRLFAGAIAGGWAILIATALFYTPRTWVGAESSTHIHVI